jgi:hypothetical protein
LVLDRVFEHGLDRRLVLGQLRRPVHNLHRGFACPVADFGVVCCDNGPVLDLFLKPILNQRNELLVFVRPALAASSCGDNVIYDDFYLWLYSAFKCLLVVN